MSLAGCHSMVRGDHPLCLEVASEPPSRVRRLAQTIGIFGKQKDSPHGAIQTPRGGSFREVSIHAPAWGATDALLADFQESILFQSTHPRGVRLRHSWLQYRPLAVSIHAPTWGATSREAGSSQEFRVSIHAPTWGATIHGGFPLRGMPMFQSTHPRGVRLLSNCGLPSSRLFQSTHPRGVRPDMMEACGWSIEVSIHAPTWGATSPQSA